MTRRYSCPEECAASFRTRKWWTRHVTHRHGWVTISYELEDGDWELLKQAMEITGEDFQDFAYRAIKTYIESRSNDRN